jgi:hypothetical protein
MWSPSVLLRISRPMSGAVDGIDLTRFHEGRVYPFSPTLAAFVVAIGAGEPVDGDDPQPPLAGGVFAARPPERALHWTGRERRHAPR